MPVCSSCGIRTGVVILGILVCLAGCGRSSNEDLAAFRVNVQSEGTSPTTTPATEQQAVPAQAAPSTRVNQASPAKAADQAQPVPAAPVSAPALSPENAKPGLVSGVPSGTAEAVKPSAQESPAPVVLVDSQSSEQPLRETPTPRQATDLLSLVQPERDSIFGRWAREDKGLRSPGSGSDDGGLPL